jgi:small subunit ribosomal protein S6
LNYYENIVILSDTLPEEELRSAIERIKSVMTEAGAQILKADEWGNRKLAYEIEKRKKGFYILFYLKAPATLVKRLEEFYKVFDPVMKFMVIKLGPKETKALEASLQPAEQKTA